MADGMHIVMLAGEAAPLAKTGGLGDVLGSLPPELEKLGFKISVVIPRYRTIDLDRYGFERVREFDSFPFDVHRSDQAGPNLITYLIGNDDFFGRDGIYVDPATGLDFSDQADRWIFFQRSAMEFVSRLSRVDILHCHDHQVGLIPAYLQRMYRHIPTLSRAGTVFTIHNMGYQGVFPTATILRAGFNISDTYSMSPFEFYGQANFMKAAIVFSDTVTTVSETYAAEIQQSSEFGYGLEGVLRARPEPPIGILNGIDYEIWNPSRDPFLAAEFGVSDISGKRTNKEMLFREFGLDPASIEYPLLAMISRMDVQKGFDLAAAVLDELLSRDLCFVALGSGNKEIERELNSIVRRYPGRAGLRLGYDNELAHGIEAGSDIFLMPSKYEPCGLNQMYSMRYGTIPVVRATGGLADTVQEFNAATGQGTGFRFVRYDPAAFREAIDRALVCFTDRPAWERMMRNGMSADFSWSRSALRYAGVYEDVKRRHSA